MSDTKPIEELAATWAAWSRHATIVATIARLEEQGECDGAAALRQAVPADGVLVAALDAVAAGHELVTRVVAVWGDAVDAALDGGASWDDIGDVVGLTAAKARALRGRGLSPVPAAPSPAAGPGDWLNTEQVAARTHRHVETVRRQVGAGELHGHQATRRGRAIRGSRWTFRPAAVDAWVEGLDVAAQARACGCKLAAVPAGGRAAGGGRR